MANWEGLKPTLLICYDRPSSFLATLGHPELSPIGELLDHKIDAVAAAVCAH